MCSKYAHHSRLNSKHDWGMGRGELVWRLNEHENIRFDNEYDTYMNLEHYTGNGYKHDMDLLINSDVEITWITHGFETPPTSQHFSHVKARCDIVVLQDHLKPRENDAIMWIFGLKDQIPQHVHEILERKKHILHLKSIKMEESEHKNTLQLTQRLLQHVFRGTPCTTKAWRVGNFNLIDLTYFQMLQLEDENSLFVRPQESRRYTN
jgi:hypothetical protein